MDKRLMIGIFVILLAGLILPFAHSASGAKGPMKIDAKVSEAVSANEAVRAIVTLKNNESVSDFFGLFKETVPVLRSDVLNNYGINATHKYNFSNSFSAQLTPDEVKKLESDNRVEQITYDYPVHEVLQQSVPLIKANDTWSLKVNGTNLTGKGESVCIIDTGVDYNHTDLGGGWGNKVIAGFRSLKDKAEQQDCSTNYSACFDDNGHGTHVSGIVAANGSIKGVAPGANIIMVKALDASGGGYTSDILYGIEWCTSHAQALNISVISMSLGTTFLFRGYCDTNDTAMTSAVNAATAKNISVVAAAGNDGNTTSIASPACIQNVTSVGMTYKKSYSPGYTWETGKTWADNCTDINPSVDQIVCSSDRNNITDLFAPGAVINSTWNNGGYKEEGGTSMATPHVAAAFALIDQYEKLHGKTLTPLEIQDALNATGKRITDTGGSGLTFSRINVYDAVLSLDKTPPVVKLASPANNTISSSGNITFNCNATDDLKLSNLTLKIWNPDSLYYNKTLIENNSNSPLNLTETKNLIVGNYKWGCDAYDNNSNFAETQNFTLTVPSNISTTLVSPKNDFYTNLNSTINFTCIENSTKNLTNSTFLIWNSTRLIYNETKNISGTSNSTTFNYSFSNEGSYLWNCKTYNNLSDSAAATNRTLIYDRTAPHISLVGPADRESYKGTTNVKFQYNVSDSSLTGCNLTINNSIAATNDSVSLDATNEFTKSLGKGDYNWSIECVDLAGNSNSTGNRSISIKAASQSSSSLSSSGGSSGGGGSGSYMPPTTYKVNVSAPEGSTKKIKSGDSLSFSVGNINHILTLDGFQNSAALLTIHSMPINISLKANQTTRISLNSDGYYNLQITLNSIQGDYANLTLKRINESIPTVHILTNQTPQNSSNSTNVSIKSPIATKVSYVYIMIIIIIAIAAVVIFLVFKRRKLMKQLKTSPDRKQVAQKSQEYLKSSDTYSSNGKSAKGKTSG